MNTNGEPIHPLTVAQQALWALGRLAANDSFGNLCTALRISPQLDLGRLRTAVQSLHRLHGILRARVISTEPSTPFMALDGDSTDMQFTIQTEADWDDEDRDAWIDRESRRPLDLKRYVCRFSVLVLTAASDESSREVVLLIIAHHMIADYRSMELLTQDLEVLYRSRKSSSEVLTETPPPVVPFLLYAGAERLWLRSEEAERERRFWQQTLGTIDARPIFGRTSATIESMFLGVERRSAFAPSDTGTVRAVSQSIGVTAFTFVLSVFALIVTALSQRRRFSISITIDLRRDRQLRRAVGYFVNTVPVVVSVPSTGSFEELALATGRSVLVSMRHARLPFADVAQQARKRTTDIRYITTGALFTWLKFEPDFGGGGPSDRLILDTLRMPTRLISMSHEIGLSIEDRRDTFECLWALNSVALDRTLGTAIIQWLPRLVTRAALDVAQPIDALIAITVDALAAAANFADTRHI